MKIMLVIRWPVGGIKTYLQYLYKFPILSHHEYIIVAPDLELNKYVESVFANSKFSFFATEDSSSNLYSITRKIITTERPDLVHSHGTTAGIIVSSALLFSSTPHLLTTHDVFFNSQFQGYSGWIKKRFIKFMLNKADVINPCGFDAADNFINFFPSIPKNKVKAIRNGIDIDKFKIETIRNLRNETKIDNNVVLLGFFGRFMSQKGFDLLVGALKELTDGNNPVALHVACFGWGGFIREEQEKIRNEGLENIFTFFDQTDDMPAALRGVDVAIMPSRWEACPLLPMEALVVGTPVIASDCVGMNEVCQGSPAQLFCSNSIPNLTDTIRNTFLNLDAIKDVSKIYKCEAITKFDSKKTAFNLNQLYVSMIND